MGAFRPTAGQDTGFMRHACLRMDVGLLSTRICPSNALRLALPSMAKPLSSCGASTPVGSFATGRKAHAAHRHALPATNPPAASWMPSS